MLLRERRVREDHAADREPERGPAGPFGEACERAVKCCQNVDKLCSAIARFGEEKKRGDDGKIPGRLLLFFKNCTISAYQLKSVQIQPKTNRLRKNVDKRI